MNSNGRKLVKLEDFLINTPRNGIYKSKEFQGSGAKLIKMGDLFSNLILNENNIEENYIQLTDDEEEKLLLKENDLIFSRTSLILEGVGKCAIIGNINEKITFESNTFMIRLDSRKINPKYILYYFSSELGRNQIATIANQTAAASIRSRDLIQLPIEIPSLKEQDKIVEILSNLDNKIENNNDIIFNLTNVAQAIFIHWFIDYEFPSETKEWYKSSGNKMEETEEFGLIPYGWKVGTISDFGDIIGGGTPSKKKDDYFVNEGVPWITPKDLSNHKSRVFIRKGASDITEEALKNSSAKLLPEGTVLYSSRAPIGYVAIAENSVSTNQGFKSIIPNPNVPSQYIYFLLKRLTPTIEANAGGTTFKEISGSGLKKIKCIIPEMEILKNYGRLTDPIFEEIKVKEQEIRLLEEIKSSLLSKLISGDIQVPLEEEFVNV